MKVTCPGCMADIGTFEPVATCSVQVHCPFCGKDFGARVAPAGKQLESPESGTPPAGGWRP